MRLVSGLVVVTLVLSASYAATQETSPEEKIRAANELLAEIEACAAAMKESKTDDTEPTKIAAPPYENVEPTKLSEELRRLDAQITVDQAELNRYKGGLIKTLIGLRLEVLKNTRTMLEQRQLSLDYNVRITYLADGQVFVPQPPDQEQLDKLTRDLEEQEAKLYLAEAKNEKYSGGLVKSMILSQIATTKNTIAFLEQRRLCEEYQIPYLLSFETSQSATPSPAQTESPFEILDVSTRVTESNSSWWKYAWIMTVRNLSDRHLNFTAEIEFVDQDGFVIDDDTERGLQLNPGEDGEFAGYALIEADIAPNVSGVRAKIKM